MPSAAELQERLQALEARLNGPSKPEPSKPQVYTREQIRQAVESGEITQATADGLLDQQQVTSTSEIAATAAREALEADRRAREMDGEIARYREKVPTLLDDDSDDAKKVMAEVERLRSMGVRADPKMLGLLALRSVHGNPLNIARVSETEVKGETHQEGASGDGGPAKPARPASDGPPAGLSDRQRAFYERAISTGGYSSWEAVKKELAFVPGPGH